MPRLVADLDFGPLVVGRGAGVHDVLGGWAELHPVRRARAAQRVGPVPEQVPHAVGDEVRYVGEPPEADGREQFPLDDQRLPSPTDGGRIPAELRIVTQHHRDRVRRGRGVVEGDCQRCIQRAGDVDLDRRASRFEPAGGERRNLARGNRHRAPPSEVARLDGQGGQFANPQLSIRRPVDLEVAEGSQRCCRRRGRRVVIAPAAARGNHQCRAHHDRRHPPTHSPTSGAEPPRPDEGDTRTAPKQWPIWPPTARHPSDVPSPL